MLKHIVLLTAVIAAFTAGTVAQATVGWKVFATGTDSSEYGAYVSANADVLHPHALAVRASRPGKVSWNLSCQSEDKQAAAGTIVVVSVAAAKKCTLYGSANTEEPGTLRVQLLKR